MEPWIFVDLATKAKELKINEGTLRARILSRVLPCFIYASDLFCCASPDNWLPPHDPIDFPDVSWLDHGYLFHYDDGLQIRRILRDKAPHYHIKGWVELDAELTADILTRGKAELDFANAYVTDRSDGRRYGLMLRAQPHTFMTVTGPGEDDFYETETPILLTPSDLFMCATEDAAPNGLPSRKEQSYLGIISAMRALLRDKEGGNFPSDAKIIDQLVDRYKVLDGVSKRNLEGVFADATRANGDVRATK